MPGSTQPGKSMSERELPGYINVILKSVAFLVVAAVLVFIVVSLMGWLSGSHGDSGSQKKVDGNQTVTGGGSVDTSDKHDSEESENVAEQEAASQAADKEAALAKIMRAFEINDEDDDAGWRGEFILRKCDDETKMTQDDIDNFGCSDTELKMISQLLVPGECRHEGNCLTVDQVIDQLQSKCADVGGSEVTLDQVNSLSCSSPLDSECLLTEDDDTLTKCCSAMAANASYGQCFSSAPGCSMSNINSNSNKINVLNGFLPHTMVMIE